MASAEEKLRIHEAIDALADKAEDLDALTSGLAALCQELVGVPCSVIAAERPDVLPPARDLTSLSAEALRLIDTVRDDEGWTESDLDELNLIALRPKSVLVGALVVQGRARDPELMSSFVQRADSAVCHALDRELLRDRNRELTTIYEIDNIRDLHLDFDDMIEAIQKKVIELLPVDLAFVALRGLYDDSTELRYHLCGASEAIDAGALLAAHESDFSSIVEGAFNTRGPERATIDDRECICVPLILEDEILGGFAVLSPAGVRLKEREVRLFTAICSQADTAIFEDVQRQRIKDVFKRYVSKDVFDEMLRREEDFLEGKRREVTCFFSDLRGFTSVSEQLNVDEVVGMLNEHLEAMCEIIFAHGGTVDKFIGDCVMAFFGAPLPQDDHVERAVAAAIEMRAAHNAIADRWKARGLPPVKVGIGLHTGEVFVGNIGGEQMTSYTIIGDHVNLASRLEGVSGGDDIVISKDVVDRLPDTYELEPRGEITVKGKTVPTSIFNVRGEKS